MERLRYRSLLLPPLVAGPLVMLLGVTEVAGFGYLDSLSLNQPVMTTKRTSAGNYLDSLPTTATATATATNADWMESIAEAETKTPDDHYAKDNPGAGWAGYKDPMYGGYLDHLSPSSESKSESSSCSSHHIGGISATGDASHTNACVLEAGKKADYGDDVRWGAQVYLDNLN